MAATCLQEMCSLEVAWWELGNLSVPSWVGWGRGWVREKEVVLSPPWGICRDGLYPAVAPSCGRNKRCGIRELDQETGGAGAALLLSLPGPPDRHTAPAPEAGG